MTQSESFDLINIRSANISPTSRGGKNASSNKYVSQRQISVLLSKYDFIKLGCCSIYLHQLWPK